MERPRTLLSPTLDELTDRFNAPVQGTGADGLKVALALLWERRGECPSAVPILVCHDEIVVECDEDRGEEIKRWLEKAMIEGMDTSGPRLAEKTLFTQVPGRCSLRSWTRHRTDILKRPRLTF